MDNVIQRPSVAQLSLGGFIIVASWIAGIFLLGSNVSTFVNLNLLLIVAAGPAMLAVMHRTKSVANLADAAVAAGCIGTVIGLIHVMENLDKPEYIGHGIAVSSLDALYGLMVYFLTDACATHRGEEVQNRKSADTVFYGILSFTLLIAITFVVLYALKINYR